MREQGVGEAEGRSQKHLERGPNDLAWDKSSEFSNNTA